MRLSPAIAIIWLIIISDFALMAQVPSSMIRRLIKNPMRSELYISRTVKSNVKLYRNADNLLVHFTDDVLTSPLSKHINNYKPNSNLSRIEVENIYRKHGFGYDNQTYMDFNKTLRTLVVNDSRYINASVSDINSLYKQQLKFYENVKSNQSFAEDIELSQAYLKEMGYYKGKIDQDWGSNSQKAFEAYYADYYNKHSYNISSSDNYNSNMIELELILKTQLRKNLPIEQYSYKKLREVSKSIKSAKANNSIINVHIIRRRKEMLKRHEKIVDEKEVLSDLGVYKGKKEDFSNQEYMLAKKEFNERFIIPETEEYRLFKSNKDEAMFVYRDSDDFIKHLDEVYGKNQFNCTVKPELCITENFVSLKLKCDNACVTFTTSGTIEISMTSRATNKSYAIKFPQKGSSYSIDGTCQTSGKVCFTTNNISGSFSYCDLTLDASYAGNLEVSVSNDNSSIDIYK